MKLQMMWITSCKMFFKANVGALQAAKRFFFATAGLRQNSWPSVAALYSTYGRYSEGEKLTRSRTFSPEEVAQFGLLVRDHNPLHTDEEFAKTTMFGRPIVQGLLISGMLTGAMYDLVGPGGIISKIQCEFRSPLYVGEDTTMEVELDTINGRKCLIAGKCWGTESNKVIMTMDTDVLLPKQSV